MRARILGGLVLLSVLGFGPWALAATLAFIAVVFAGANVVGGYWVTDRMLEMFKRRPVPKADKSAK